MGSLRHVLLAMALAAGAPAMVTAATPEAGAAAPGFELPGAAGGTHSLAAALEEGPVVLVFYRAFW